ncbi:M16 family metallopeptidase [Paenibacillus lutimineralis]|uniref:Insulinase family protein n=1 Tax=Paenibacillus lutimineralis TaxID=2707005 RepID=A0A3Q9I844_9BACL|nr:insulinase family protein [Paenibacillus lutimineralis]AZS13297.1 insulinase family protein [Paenibacillus lutimineralis]
MKDRISEGTLPNGLAYCVRETDIEKDEIMLSLALKVGSLQESDSENGLAHVVEHMSMVFDKYRYYAGDIQYNCIGLTDFDRTVYLIKCPNRNEAIRHGLFILKQIALGSYITIEALDEVKQDVLQEVITHHKGRKSKVFKILFDHSFYKTRLPMGDEEVIKGLSFEQVIAFHEKWYTPDRMAINIAGDIKTDEVIKWIETEFGSLSCSSNAESNDMNRCYQLNLETGAIKRVVTSWKVNHLEMYINNMVSDEVNIKNEACNNILAILFEKICVHALKESNVEFSFFSSSFVNLMNCYQFLQMQIVYCSDLHEKITDVMERLFDRIQKDSMFLKSYFEETKQEYLEYFDSKAYLSDLSLPNLMEESIDHFILDDPLISYEQRIQNLMKMIDDLFYIDIRILAQQLLRYEDCLFIIFQGNSQDSSDN